MKFRKKPEIEAMKYDGTTESAYRIMRWAHDGLPPEANAIVTIDHYSVIINTLEGRLYASPGDWVIRGVMGEFYPCKHDIFEKTYESID